MQQLPTNFIEWQKKFARERTCIRELERHRWPNGFICPNCSHDQAYRLKHRHLHECKACKRQTSATAGTIFEHTKLPLTKWFAAIFLMSVDKGGISAMRLSKLIGVSWPTAHAMLRKLRQAMGDRDRAYWLDGIVEVDDAYVGGRKAGKRGRGAEGKTVVLLAVEKRGEGAGYLAAQAVNQFNQKRVRQFAERIAPDAQIRSDAFSALKGLADHHLHDARVTPAEKVDQWLPTVHIVIANLKRYLLGTYHGVSRTYLQEYIDEFVFRFNRRSWESQLPRRLIQAAVDHVPVPIRLTHV